jgi:hypothetical protein
MRVDLRQLVAAQDQFRSDSGRYSVTAPPGFRSSVGVNTPHIVLTSNGWHATVTHSMPAPTCVIYVGDAHLSPAVQERRAACSLSPFRATDYQVASLFWSRGSYWRRGRIA